MDFEMALPKPDRLEDAILVTHKGCMDGSGCAIMFMLAGGKRENIRFVAAGMVEKFVKKDPVFSSDKFLIFADVGLNTPKYADILEKRGNLVMLDHHNTSLHLLGRHWAQIEETNQRCGTRMLRDYLIELGDAEAEKGPPFDGPFTMCRVLKSSSYRNFADLLDDHDRWIRKIPGSEDMATIMSFLGQQDFITRFSDPKDRICQNIAKGRSKVFLTEFEEDLLGILAKRRDEAIAEAIEKAFVRDVKLPDDTHVNVGFVITMEPNISLLLQRLLEAKPEIQIAASICIEKGAVSLRSRGGVPDCSYVAGLFSGGGHKGAAGHRLPQDLNDMIVEHIYG
jgi:oligoribonuclease NrnB/cAMP/cGMP phosphodiesterase (DHH superfamily)